MCRSLDYKAWSLRKGGGGGRASLIETLRLRCFAKQKHFVIFLSSIMHDMRATSVAERCEKSVNLIFQYYLDRVKRIWYLSPMRAAKVQASLRIRAVSPEPSLLAHTSSESRGTFRQKARSLAPLNGWACAVEICHDGMLEDTNSLDGAHLYYPIRPIRFRILLSSTVFM